MNDNFRHGMPSEYFETVFLAEEKIKEWPDEFAIITAWAPTGEIWQDDQNRAADRRLHKELLRREVWLRRLTGQSPNAMHSEPGWAVAVPFETACDIGESFLQVAIYFVSDDDLLVSFCDWRRRLLRVGPFLERVSFRIASES
jgi:hypothetical protein